MSEERELRPPADRGELRLYDALQALRAEWRLLTAIVVTFTAGAVVLSIVMTPVYRAEATVTLVDANRAGDGSSALLGQLGGLAGLAGVNLSGLSGSTNTARVVLKSRTLIEEFIQRQELLPVLFEEEGEAANRRTLWRGVEAFKRIYDVDEDLQTGVMTVRVEWTSAELAASWANQLVDLANALMRQRALTDAERNIEYLNDQLGRTNVVELQQVIYNLIEAEMKTLMLANVRNEYAFSVVDPAVVPELRARPKRKQLVVLGALLGGIVGLFVVAVSRSLQNLRVEQSALRDARSPS
jgi:uncharacterized protein involved in exopolysaccharide biosynthesis